MSARSRRTAIALVLALILGAPPAALASGQITPPKPIRIRTSATAVWPALMCPTCHEPLALAQSPQAIDEREYVQTLINQGYTRPQILTIMVQQLGEGVLAKPPASGFNLTIYILPPAVLVAGIAFLLYTLPKWRARARRAALQPMAPGTQSLSAEDAERLETDLAAYD